jgi:hypothetical protein
MPQHMASDKTLCTRKKKNPPYMSVSMTPALCIPRFVFSAMNLINEFGI